MSTHSTVAGRAPVARRSLVTTRHVLAACWSWLAARHARPRRRREPHEALPLARLSAAARGYPMPRDDRDR